MSVTSWVRGRVNETGWGCWTRWKAISADAGQWGKFLSCILMFSWAMNITVGDGTIEGWGGLSGLTKFMGKDLVVAWLLTASILPVVGIIVGWVPLRVVTSTYILISWLWLFFETILVGNIGRPALWSCVVGVMACLNSEIRLADSVVNKTDGR